MRIHPEPLSEHAWPAACCAIALLGACSWGIYDGSFDGGASDAGQTQDASKDATQVSPMGDGAPLADGGSVADARPSAAPLPSARSALAVAQFNNRVLVFGGKDSTGAPTKTVFALGSNNAWAQLADMPVARYAHGAVAPLVIDGQANLIFVVGGYDASGNPISEVDRYDAMTDSWTNFTSLPTPRGELAVAVDDTTIIAAGGATQPGGSAQTIVDTYNATINVWGASNQVLPVRPLGTARRGATAAASGGYLTVIGGAPSQNSIEYLTGSSGTWNSSGPPLGHGRGYAAAVPVGGVSNGNGGFINNGAGVVLVLGGSDGANVLNVVEGYVPGAGTIELPPMPTPRKWLGAGLLYSMVLAIGGEDANGKVLDVVEAFDTRNATW